jgi:hypothetical protein
MSGNDAHRTDVSEFGNQSLMDAVGKVISFFLPTHVYKRQHGKGLDLALCANLFYSR